MAACFSCKRSFGRHSRLLLPPETPIRKSLRSVFPNRGQPPLIVVLACGSLGLIGLSRFLQCSVPFFCPPFSAVFAVFALVVPLRSIPAVHTAKHCLSQAKAVIPSLHSAGYIPFFHSGTCFARKKNYTSRQKIAPALPFHGRRPQPPLRYGYLCPPPSLHSQTARASPLRSKKITPLPLRKFFTASFRLKAVLPALFYATPTHSPRPPTPKKQLHFLFYLRYHAGF